MSRIGIEKQKGTQFEKKEKKRKKCMAVSIKGAWQGMADEVEKGPFVFQVKKLKFWLALAGQPVDD